MRLGAILTLAVAIMAVAMGEGRAAQSGDWPCIQPRNPSLSVATFWTGEPLADDTLNGWRKDTDVAKLVAKLVSRRTSIEDAEKIVADFAAKLPPEAKLPRLTLVFAGVFNELNTLRTSIVNNIERFARTQKRVSADMDKDRGELNELRALATKDDQQRARIEELQTKLQWQIRLHKEREGSLRYVCETPVLLEQRIFAISRAVQSGM